MDYCPNCQKRLVEHLLERGVALACPACWQVHQFAEYVANSPIFSTEVRTEADKVSDAAFQIGLIALGGLLLAAIFDKPKRRR